MLLPPGASPASGQDQRQRIFLEFSRDEDVEGVADEFEKAKNRTRSILIGNCRLIDNKLEKAGSYEVNPPAVSNQSFDLLKH